MAGKSSGQNIRRKTFQRSRKSCYKTKSRISLRFVVKSSSNERYNGHDAWRNKSQQSQNYHAAFRLGVEMLESEYPLESSRNAWTHLEYDPSLYKAEGGLVDKRGLLQQIEDKKRSNSR